MKYNDKTIQDELAKTVQQFFGIDVAKTTFIPIGEESYGYQIEDGRGNRFFIKYCTSPEVIQTLPTVHEVLKQLSAFDFVILPIVNPEGETFTKMLEGTLYGYPFYDGDPITQGNQDFPRDLTSRVQAIMETIYVVSVSNINLNKETFTHTFDTQFETIRLRAKQVPEILCKLDQSEETIKKLLEMHTTLADTYQKNPPKLVLTHGDITGLNMLVKGNELKLVDWDGVMLAPAERDINFLLDNPHFDKNRYLQQTGKEGIDKRLIEYYSQQWSLGSILGNFETLIDNPQFTEEDKAECYSEINEYLGYYQ